MAQSEYTATDSSSHKQYSQQLIVALDSDGTLNHDWKMHEENRFLYLIQMMATTELPQYEITKRNGRFVFAVFIICRIINQMIEQTMIPH